MILRATEVFTPNDFPKYTYVDRQDDRLEERLSNAFQTPKTVVSISGPSKSGKTVLVEQVVGRDNLIVVSGAEIQESRDIWVRVLDWMGSPSERTLSTQTQTTQTSTGRGSLSAGIPSVIQIGADLGKSDAAATTVGRSEKFSTPGLAQVVKEIGQSEFVVLLDDFHYIARPLQAEAAKQIKAAAERGVKICVASVPHRSDDVVRSNPELRGRTANLDTNFWNLADLAAIARRGFEALNVNVPDAICQDFARESCGSPQIMQTICLQFCFRTNCKIRFETATRPAFESVFTKDILEEASLRADYSSLVSEMHEGPKLRGTERKEFEFNDGSKGDVYRAILLAIAADPPRMSIPYNDLMQRIKAICFDDTPVGRSVTESCEQIVKFAVAKYPEQKIIEFEADGGPGTVSIVDPYWLFYIRSSTKLDSLGQTDNGQA